MTTIDNADRIIVLHDTIHLDLSTGYRDAIYVRTGYPLLGSITDPEYGYFRAGYLAQFYSSPKIGLNDYSTIKSDSLVFDILRTSVPRDLGLDPAGIYTPWDSLINNRLDSLTLRIYYTTYYGDSLVPQQLTVYSLNDDADLENCADSEFYSNTDYTKYYNQGKVIGRKTFTAANRILSDSIRGLSNYQPYIEIKLNDELKESFLRAATEAAIARDAKGHKQYPDYKDIFRDIQTMRNKWLSGVAIQSTYGDGALIKVQNTAVYFFYTSLHRYDKDGTLLRNDRDDADTTYIQKHVAYMAVTPDVVQMSQMEQYDEKNHDRMEDKKLSYITSPQGYYAQVELPAGRIMRRLMSHVERRDSSYFLSGANFSLICQKPQGVLFSKEPPARLLMVEESQMKSFFEDRKVSDGYTSAVATYVADSVKNNVYYYNYGDISTIITGVISQDRNGGWRKSMTTDQWKQRLHQKGLIKDLSDEALDAFTVRMAMVPVEVTTSATYGTVLSVSNRIMPSAVCALRDPSRQVIQYIYTFGGAD